MTSKLEKVLKMFQEDGFEPMILEDKICQSSGLNKVRIIETPKNLILETCRWNGRENDYHESKVLRNPKIAFILAKAYLYETYSSSPWFSDHFKPEVNEMEFNHCTDELPF